MLRSISPCVRFGLNESPRPLCCAVLLHLAWCACCAARNCEGILPIPRPGRKRHGAAHRLPPVVAHWSSRPLSQPLVLVAPLALSSPCCPLGMPTCALLAFPAPPPREPNGIGPFASQVTKGEFVQALMQQQEVRSAPGKVRRGTTGRPILRTILRMLLCASASPTGVYVCRMKRGCVGALKSMVKRAARSGVCALLFTRRLVVRVIVRLAMQTLRLLRISSWAHRSQMRSAVLCCARGEAQLTEVFMFAPQRDGASDR